VPVSGCKTFSSRASSLHGARVCGQKGFAAGHAGVITRDYWFPMAQSGNDIRYNLWLHS